MPQIPTDNFSRRPLALAMVLAMALAQSLSACGGDTVLSSGNSAVNNPPPNVQLEAMGDQSSPMVVIRWEQVKGAQYYALYRTERGEGFAVDAEKDPDGEIIATSNSMMGQLSMDGAKTFSFADSGPFLSASGAYVYDLRMCVVPKNGLEEDEEATMIDGIDTVCIGSITGIKTIDIAAALRSGI